MNKFTQSDDYRREELIRIIEHSVEKLTLQELEALCLSRDCPLTARDCPLTVNSYRVTS